MQHAPSSCQTSNFNSDLSLTATDTRSLTRTLDWIFLVLCRRCHSYTAYQGCKSSHEQGSLASCICAQRDREDVPDIKISPTPVRSKVKNGRIRACALDFASYKKIWAVSNSNGRNVRNEVRLSGFEWARPRYFIIQLVLSTSETCEDQSLPSSLLITSNDRPRRRRRTYIAAGVSHF